METYSDKQLHEIARKRVDFRRHLVVYFIVNGILWCIWFFTDEGYPWPVWPTAGWGIGLLFQYIFAFRSLRFLSEEEEYKRLKEEMEKLGRTAE